MNMSLYWGPPREKRDGVIGHISEPENVNWMKIIAWLRETSIWHPTWLGKLGVNMNFMQFLGVICAKNLRESGISSPPWGAPYRHGVSNNIMIFLLVSGGAKDEPIFGEDLQYKKFLECNQKFLQKVLKHINETHWSPSNHHRTNPR